MTPGIIYHRNECCVFNEAEWLRLLFLINDTMAWMGQIEKDIMYQLPVADKSKLFRKTFYLPATSLAHLLEKHYHKISRHPGCSKFTVDVPDVVHWIREAYKTAPQPISGSLNYKRCLDTGTVIGYTKEGTPTTFVTVITSVCGEVKTAFPGPYLL